MAGRSTPSSMLHALAAGPRLRNTDSCVISNRRAFILKKHNHTAFVCAWDPKGDFLATGSADATVCLWDIEDISRRLDPSKCTKISNEGNNNNSSEHQEITSMEWHPDGERLLTGCYLGVARLWHCRNLVELAAFEKHKDLIFASKWNKSGTRFLTASGDNTVIMWHAETRTLSQKFKFHTASVNDVDWQSDVRFASCSYDAKIHVCELDEFQPVRTFNGHTRMVNTIAWGPQSNLLASCSHDMTVKLWSTDSAQCVLNLTDHSKEVHKVAWRPTGLQLASASYDKTVRLWDVESGKCTHTLTGHANRVYGMAFSPDGLFLASGSSDNTLRIWSVESGALLKMYRSTSTVFSIRWNNTGKFVAACLSGGSVIVLDLRY